jgi:cell division protein ZapA
MNTVSLSIHNRTYTINCADGQENELYHLGSLVDDYVQKIAAIHQGASEIQLLIISHLMLCSELETLKGNTITPETCDRLDGVVKRLKSLVSELNIPYSNEE